MEVFMAQKTFNQTSFANVLVKTKEELHQTLATLLEKIDWSQFDHLLSPIHNKVQGRKSYPNLLMLKCLLLQNWHNLSDYELEKSIDDRLSFRRFIGLDYTANAPDHSSFSRFRDQLIQHGLESKVFEEISNQIENHGLVVKAGTLVDASVVQADVQRPSPKSDGSGGRSDVDPDATWTKKNGRSHFGYKVHVGLDENSGLIRKRALTPAHVHDSRLFEDMVTGDKGSVYADKAYASEKNDNFLRENGIQNGILFKHQNGDSIRARCNWHLSRIRSRVETVFAILKRHYGYRRVRYRSLVKNSLQFTLLCICYNLKKICT